MDNSAKKQIMLIRYGGAEEGWLVTENDEVVLCKNLQKGPPPEGVTSGCTFTCKLTKRACKAFHILPCFCFMRHRSFRAGNFNCEKAMKCENFASDQVPEGTEFTIIDAEDGQWNENAHNNLRREIGTYKGMPKGSPILN